MIRRKSRKKKIILLSLLLVLVATTAGAHQWYRHQLRPVDENAEQQLVRIEPGMSSTAIADLLESEGLIRDALAFRVYARLNNLSGSIQAGSYGLSAAQSTPEILRTIAQGLITEDTIRIPSGFELAQIIELLEQAGYEREDIDNALAAEYPYEVLRDKPSSATLEGYLFPDTYNLPNGDSVTELIDVILANMNRQVTDDIVSAWASYGLNIHEGITLASIVQKEVPSSGEKEIVSQVFHKRLADGMMLQADPTYMYGARQLGVPAGPNLDSPYNTYRVEGLPPGPIANVTAAALEASARPAETEYVYFVTGDDGVTRFSETQEQHDAYIRDYGISGT